MKRLFSLLFLLLISLNSHAHFSHFEPRIAHIFQEGKDAVLLMRMPLPLILLDESWQGGQGGQEVAFTRQARQEDRVDYLVDRDRIYSQFNLFSQRIKDGYQLRVNGAAKSYEIEAVNLFNSDTRKPFSSKETALSNFSDKISIHDDVYNLFDVGIDFKIRARNVSLADDDLVLHSGLGEKFNAINRLANIVNLYRNGGKQSITTVGVLDYSSAHLPSLMSKLLDGFSSGLVHILIGLDHVILVLLIFFSAGNLTKLISLATAFTVGHSFSLVFGENLAITTPLFTPGIELLIALSISVAAVALLLNKGQHLGSTPMMVIGIIHGFGFSFVFNEIAREGAQQGLSTILSFTAGIEAGQLLVYLAAFVFAFLIRKYFTLARPLAYYVSLGALLISGYWVITRTMPLLDYVQA